MIRKREYYANGKLRESRYFVLDFFDHNQIRRRLSLLTSKRASEAIARDVDELIDHHKANERPTAELQHRLAALPERITKNLVKWRLLSEQANAAKRALKDHLADFIADIEEKGRSFHYCKKLNTRVANFLKAANFTHFRDITPERTDRTLRSLNLSQNTKRHYSDAIKTFLNWAKEKGRIQANPLENFTIQRQQPKRKGVLTPDQFMELLRTTISKNRIIGQSTGQDRALLYALAGCTGLRRNELLSLTWQDMRLNEKTPFVLARADTTKNALEAVQPIPAWIADMLGAVKAQRRASEADRVFDAIDICENTANLIRADLTAANIPLRDSDGNEIVFHSLRNSFISFLVNSGAPMKVVQKLARHSDPKLTFNTYARTFEASERDAIGLLPDFEAFQGVKNCDINCAINQHKPEETRESTGDNSPKTAITDILEWRKGYNNPQESHPLNSTYPIATKGLTEEARACPESQCVKKHTLAPDLQIIVNAWPQLTRQQKTIILLVLENNTPGTQDNLTAAFAHGKDQ